MGGDSDESRVLHGRVYDERSRPKAALRWVSSRQQRSLASTINSDERSTYNSVIQGGNGNGQGDAIRLI